MGDWRGRCISIEVFIPIKRIKRDLVFEIGVQLLHCESSESEGLAVCNILAGVFFVYRRRHKMAPCSHAPKII